MYLGVPHFFNIYVDYEVHMLPNHCNEHIYPFIYILFIISHLFVDCCVLYHPPRSQLYPSLQFCTKKVTTKTDVVGCHIGLSPSSTGRNRSPILVDCCVNAFLRLLSSMGSFTAKMVVQRRVCEIPTLRQNMFPCWS